MMVADVITPRPYKTPTNLVSNPDDIIPNGRWETTRYFEYHLQAERRAVAILARQWYNHELK